MNEVPELEYTKIKSLEDAGLTKERYFTLSKSESDGLTHVKLTNPLPEVELKFNGLEGVVSSWFSSLLESNGFDETQEIPLKIPDKVVSLDNAALDVAPAMKTVT